MTGAEQYLKPSVIRNVARLDLRARFIVEGFLTGLHSSPFHGFSVEFSEHRRYAQGDDPKDISRELAAPAQALEPGGARLAGSHLEGTRALVRFPIF